MPHDLHILYLDGAIEHAPFSRATWEDTLANPLIRSRWTHDQADCHDPAERLRGIRGLRVVELDQYQAENRLAREQSNRGINLVVQANAADLEKARILGLKKAQLGFDFNDPGIS